VTAQRGLVALAVAAGLVAGIFYWAGAQRVSIVVAAVDLATARAIGGSDVEIRSLPPDALPAGAIQQLDAVVGRFPKGPIWKGQLLVADAIADSAAAFDGGVALPTGYHAIAIPVNAGQALGGAVVPGARVDVIAIPMQGKAPPGRPTEMVAAAALVIDVRGEQGGPFERHPASRQPATAARDRLGSVVIAIGPTIELRIADRIATSTFVIALAAERP